MDNELYYIVIKRDKWRCRSCHFSRNLHVHHIVFRSHGGPDVESNLITLCANCHDGLHRGKLELIIKDLTIGPEFGNILFIRKQGWKPH